jgi:hypothetical protein
MTTRPRLSRTSLTVIENEPRADPRQHPFPIGAKELYRDPCEDDEGNHYTVIVWRPAPGLTEYSLDEYTLDDGTPVSFFDDCVFEIEGTGVRITRRPRETLMPKITIETDDDHRRVMKRIAELAGCLDDTKEERELIDLALAIEIWDAKRRPM